MPDVSDADLVRRAQGGDVEAVGALYDRHYTHIFRYLWSQVRDRHQAEDLTGEVFARMIANLPRYRPRGIPFRAWLYRIAHNLAVDHFRAQGQRELVPLYHAAGASSDGPDLGTTVERRLTAERVAEALQALDPTQQAVVVLRFLVGLSLREVASILSKSVAAIKSIQHRGLVALRAALQDG